MSMKNLILIIFLFISTLSFAQKDIITIYLKNGESFKTEKISEKKNNFKFKDVEGNSQEIEISKVDKIISTGKKEKNNYTKMYITYSEKKGALMEEIVNGKVNLYKFTESSFGPPMGTMGPSRTVTITYYAKRDNESVATYLQGNNVAYGSYRKNLQDYFKDCAAVLAMVKEDNFKRSKIDEVVEFYNSNCAK